MSTESMQPPGNTAITSAPLIGPLRPHTHTYDLLRQCIHCGFCLPTCPTYAVLGVEMDSPRGRIYQMQAVADGQLDVSDEFIEHMHCCVGCRACETACPSGVQFGKLIEAAHEHIQIQTDTSFVQEPSDSETQAGDEEPTAKAQRSPLAIALLRSFFFDIMLPSRLILSLVFGSLKLYQRSGLQMLVHRTGLFDALNNLPTPFRGKLKLPEDLMAAAQGAIIPDRFPEITSATGIQRMRVSVLTGCIMDQMFHDINAATIRVLAANGCEVVTPVQQNCCGALHVHGGEAEHGRALARQNIEAFERSACDAIIINSAGCGSTLKEYGHLLRDDPTYASRAAVFSAKVKDISEFLVSMPMNQHMGELACTVAYHDACHLLHGQKIKQQPRQLLQSIPGVTLVDLKESDWCCGSAGVYNITRQEMAQEMLTRKMTHVAETGADFIATGNPGCMLQIAMGARQRGLQIKVVHPVQMLDDAYRAAGQYAHLQSQQNIKTPQKRQVFFLGIGVGFLVGMLLLRQRKGGR